MAKCKNCGKKGLFLKLNARGLCPECAAKADAAPKSGQIIIGFNDINIGQEDRAIGHNDEEEACQFFIDELVKRGKELSRFKIEHRSSDYTSLVFDLDDFIRIKITDNVKWISLSLSMEDQQKFMNDPLFASQSNKQVRHWRSDFQSFDDLEKYVDLAEHACMPTTYNYDRDLTDKEKTVADYLMHLFIECGADPNKFYCHILSQEAELIYNSQFGDIRFKAYAKKAGGYIILDRDFSTAGIKADKNRLPFTELSDLDFLKEHLIPIKIEKGLDSKYSCEMQYYAKYPIQ